MCREILEQIADVSSHVTLSARRHNNRWTVTGPKSFLKHLCNLCSPSPAFFYIFIVTQGYSCLPNPQTEHFLFCVWPLLALEANPIITKDMRPDIPLSLEIPMLQFFSRYELCVSSYLYNYKGQGCSLFAATPTTFFWKEPMQPTRQAHQGSVPPTGQGEGLPRPYFHQKEAQLRLPPPFCFFAPETSKPTPDHIATLVVTQSASAPHHCAAPLQTAPPCPTSSSPAAASTIQTC